MARKELIDEELSDFVVVRSPRLFRSAYLLTGTPHSAEDLVQTALAKAYAAWGRVRAADDPVACVHGVLVKSFLPDRRRRSNMELPVADAFERASPDRDPVERAVLMAGLARLAALDCQNHRRQVGPLLQRRRRGRRGDARRAPGDG